MYSPYSFFEGNALVWGIGGLGFIVALLWSVFWKGTALWTAAKRDDKWWFLAFLFINTIGVLEIIYLFLITKEGLSRVKQYIPGLKTESSTASTNEEKKG